MTNTERALNISTCTWADFLKKEQVLSAEIRPLLTSPVRIAGPAFTVRCPHGDNLMLHAAIHKASAGSVLVVESEDTEFAVAGGNVCRVAQKNKIAGMVIDGAIRDLGEIREINFPVFSKALSPIPGSKNFIDVFNNSSVIVGGVSVSPGDWIIADEEGIVVVPNFQFEELLNKAEEKMEKDENESLENWERKHKEKIFEILQKKNFTI